MGASGRNDAARQLGAALRGHRVRRGLSLRALARQVGLSAHGTLVDYEHGRRIPPEDLLIACEKALGVEDEALLRLRGRALAERAELSTSVLLAGPADPPPMPSAVSSAVPPVVSSAVPPVVSSAVSAAAWGAAPPVEPPGEPGGVAGCGQGLPAPPAGATRRRGRVLVALGVVVLLAGAAAVAVATRSPDHGRPAARLRFGFETPADRWGIFWGRQKAKGEVSSALHEEGAHAYAVTSAGASEGKGPQHGYVAFGTTHGLESLRSGMRVTVHMWTSYPNDGVRFFADDVGSRTVWAPETPDNGSEVPVSGGAQWSTLTFTVPPVSKVTAIGVQIYQENDDVRVVAIDDVSW